MKRQLRVLTWLIHFLYRFSKYLLALNELEYLSLLDMEIRFHLTSVFIAIKFQI